MRKKYQVAINFLENKLSTEYIKIATKMKNNIFDRLSLTHNYCAERTLAYFSNNIFIEYLNKYNIEKYIMSEVQITPNIQLSQTTKAMYAKKVGINKPLKNELYNGILVPDTVILLENELFNSCYFIEYKIHHNSFSYIKLAYDYLKYKVYTHNSTIDNKFIYIIFNHAPIPTLITSPNIEPKIQFIDDIITKKIIDKTANVFIYDYKIISDEIEENSIDDIIGIKELINLEKVMKSLDVIENSSSINYDEITDLSENIYLKNINVLGKKVANSQLMIKYYKDLKQTTNDLNITVEELIKDANKYSEKPINNEKELYEWMKKYYNNYNYKMFTQVITNNNDAISKVVKRKTMMFLITFNKFCEINDVTGCSIFLRSEKEQKDYDELCKTTFMSEYHRDGENKEKLSILVKSILYFITNLYNVMYEDENGNLIVDEEGNVSFNDKYSIYLEKKKIIEAISTIKYLFSIGKKTKVTWESDINKLGEELLKLIVNKTLKIKKE